MPQHFKDSFLDLERHRQLLEDNIEKLRKSLRHWQVWEAEYEGLKEEIRSVPQPSTREKLIAIGNAFEGELVTKAEVEDILGAAVPRSTEQVVNILEWRIDYVAQNVQTLQKQLDAAEHKLANAAIISNPDIRNEEGLPMMEIVEDLDEEGNIISGSTSIPGSARGQLLEILQKAGVKDLSELQQTNQMVGLADDRILKTAGNSLHAQVAVEPPKRPKKSVTFAEDTTLDAKTMNLEIPQHEEKTVSLTEQQKPIPSEIPIIPTDESAEDAALRKEMLEYGASEIGPVVAELNLDEDSDFTDEEYDEGDLEYDDDDDDDEDEYGRSTQGIMNAELRQKMKELEEKLGFRKTDIAAPTLAANTVDKGMEYIGFQGNVRNVSNERKAKLTKTVRFATDHDTSPSSTPKQTNTSELPASTSATSERLRATSTPPSSMPLAAELVERSVPHRTPLAPVKLDPVLLKQEVTDESPPFRNQLIGRQGGSKKDADQDKPTGRIDYDESEGGPKRVSRFKAARNARLG